MGKLKYVYKLLVKLATHFSLNFTLNFATCFMRVSKFKFKMSKDKKLWDCSLCGGSVLKKAFNVKRHVINCNKKFGIVGIESDDRINKEMECFNITKTNVDELNDENDDICELVDLCNTVVWISVNELDAFFEA